MARVRTKQQRNARRNNAIPSSSGLVPVISSHTTKGVLIQAPSGLYRQRNKSVNVSCAPQHNIEDKMDLSSSEVSEDSVRALTKKEKQAIRWLEGIPHMILWYLETMRQTQNMSRPENIHSIRGQCGTCEERGKGTKILFLLFTRTSMSSSLCYEQLLIPLLRPRGTHNLLLLMRAWFFCHVGEIAVTGLFSVRTY